MYVYNVTVSVDPAVVTEWQQWMRGVHIPDVLATGCFTGARLVRVLNVNDEGETFSVQYTCARMSDIEHYQSAFAKKLQAEHTEKFKDRYVAFRTLLEVIEEFSGKIKSR